MPKTRVHGMNVLAFDTCLGAVSAAVRWKGASGEWQVASRFEARAGGHAERLMPMIAEVMEEAGLAFADLGRIAVTVGPGTFTGVRGGVAAARGLALASGLPVVTATSLAVMAHGAREQLQGRDADLLAVAVDARRGMVYLEIFDEAQPRGQHGAIAPGLRGSRRTHRRQARRGGGLRRCGRGGRHRRGGRPVRGVPDGTPARMHVPWWRSPST